MSIRRRLEALEAQTLPAIGEWPDWPLEDQLEEVFSCLRVHKAGGTHQLATDRQIHLMGLLCALWKLPGGTGKHTFPSGLVVTWSDDEDGTKRCEATDLVEDLPEGVRGYWERMDPKKQLERERELYGLRRGRVVVDGPMCRYYAG